VAFLFAWSRMTVIQTGAIAAVAFVFGDYASEIFRLGAHSSAIWRPRGSGPHAAQRCGHAADQTHAEGDGDRPHREPRGFAHRRDRRGPAARKPATGAAAAPSAFAMIFVLLAYGGWNEAAYLAGEVRDGRKNMTRILVIGVLAVTALYLLVNIGYLAVLGHAGVKDSKAVAADVMRAIAGENGRGPDRADRLRIRADHRQRGDLYRRAHDLARWARFPAVSARLGNWREAGSTPANALLFQGAITLALVGAGAATPDGFNAMVAYTSPVFWTFFLLTGITLFCFRYQERKAPQVASKSPSIP
jgi:amino acid transporter